MVERLPALRDHAAQLKSLTAEWLTPFGPEDKARILWQSAARLYGLEKP